MLLLGVSWCSATGIPAARCALYFRAAPSDWTCVGSWGLQLGQRMHCWMLQLKGQQSRLQLVQLMGLQLQHFFWFDVDIAARGVSWYCCMGL